MTMLRAYIVGGPAAALLVAVLCGSPEGRCVVRRTWAAAVDIERTRETFSAAAMFVVVMAVFCLTAVPLHSVLLLIVSGPSWG